MLFAILQLHWEKDPEHSWLSQLERDVDAVVLYVPELRSLLDVDSKVRVLMESFSERPRWWISCVKQASVRLQLICGLGMHWILPGLRNLFRPLCKGLTSVLTAMLLSVSAVTWPRI